MSEQTANLCTTDACESLRARLAKYEDAEGNPISTIAEQAREIERLALQLEHWLSLDKLRDAALAALKAKPSGVVPAALDRAFITCESGDAGYRVVIESETLQESQQVHNWLVCLNSSPVSGSEPVYQFQYREIGEGGWSACDHDWYVHCQKSPEHDTRVMQVGVSAGGVDERAAFQEWYATPEAFKAGDSNGWSGIAWAAWKKRAALSAPSHGGQVRQTVPDGYVLVPECMHLSHEAIESITAHCGDGQEDAGYGPYSDGVLWVGEVEEEDGSKTYGIHIATADYPEEGSTTLLEFSAAPSAGSQGGDV